MQGVLFMRRLPAVVTVLVLVVCGFVWGLPAPALAHADPVITFPVDGAELDEPPAEVRITFSEPIVAAESRLIILNEAGQPIPGAHQDMPDETTLVLSLPPLDPGVYTAAWEVLSVDTHTTTGQFSFAVASSLPGTMPLQPGGAAAPPAPGAADAPGGRPGTATESGGRQFPWLWVVIGTGLLVMAGVAARRR